MTPLVNNTISQLAEMSEDSDPDIQQFTSSSDEENLERELVKKKVPY
jgi:hypothetical protein